MSLWYIIPAVIVGLFFAVFFIRLINRRISEKTEKKNVQLLGSFEGLYEVLYEAANNQVPRKTALKTIRDWNRKISLRGNILIKKKWTETLKAEGYSSDMSVLSTADIGKLQNIAKNWLEYIQSLGARRDKREYLILDATSSALYDLEESYNNGVKVQVLIPCWTYKESYIILQKGSAIVVR